MAEETDGKLSNEGLVAGFLGELEVGGDFGTVDVLGGRADDGIYRVGEASHVLQQVFDLLAFPDELGGVAEVLVLAAAVATEKRARWFDAVGGCGEDLDEVGFGEVLLVAEDAGADAFAGQAERDHDDPSAFAFRCR